jgi:hypothetical protein
VRIPFLPPKWAKDDLWTKARKVPSLDLPFSDTKSLVDATTGRSLVTFTRASSGTFVDSAGIIQTATTDAPRFDHNPTTGESLGLLVEEQRTNLLLRSEEFDNASWSKTSTTVTANSEASPTGSVTADTLTWGALQTAEAYQAVTLTAATHTLSVWAKTASGTKKFRLKYYNGTSDLFSSEQTATTQWQRFSYSFTGVAVSGNVSVRNSSPAEAGDLIVWGAQLEAGAFPTSYIPTTTATVTRSADVASISGSNFSGWFNESEGSIYTDNSNTNRVWACLSDGTTNNRLDVRGASATTAVARTVISGSESWAISRTVSLTGGGYIKTATAIGASDAFVVDGGAVGTAAGNDAAVNQLRIGARVDGADPVSGTIRRLTFWGQRLPNNILQSITQ